MLVSVVDMVQCDIAGLMLLPNEIDVLAAAAVYLLLGRDRVAAVCLVLEADIVAVDSREVDIVAVDSRKVEIVAVYSMGLGIVLYSMVLDIVAAVTIPASAVCSAVDTAAAVTIPASVVCSAVGTAAEYSTEVDIVVY